MTARVDVEVLIQGDLLTYRTYPVSATGSRLTPIVTPLSVATFVINKGPAELALDAAITAAEAVVDPAN